MYSRLSLMNPKSSCERARKMPNMKKIANHTSVTLRRNGIRALARASASVSPAAGRPMTSKITTMALRIAAA